MIHMAIKCIINSMIKQSKFYIMYTVPKYFLILFFSVALAWSAKPMEPLTNYNVIMIHGAADNVSNGFECRDATTDAYTLFNTHKNDTTGRAPWQIGGAPGMIGSYTNTDKLTYWLDTRVFEDTVRYGSDYIYIQRSFANPANSPKNNAYEIGYPKWQCGKRRSLIEEAQEVRAKGRENLADLRKNAANRDSLPPSRNILIAHSMGGVASREYVQFFSLTLEEYIAIFKPTEGEVIPR